MSLKPCPFCGAGNLDGSSLLRNEPIREVRLTQYQVAIKCNECGARGGSAEATPVAEDLWNQRQATTPIQEISAGGSAKKPNALGNLKRKINAKKQATTIHQKMAGQIANIEKQLSTLPDSDKATLLGTMLRDLPPNNKPKS